MSNDFDSDTDFDFDGDFEQTLEDFEDLDLDDSEDATIRTAVLSKNNMIALLCYKSAAEGAAICRVDPREQNPAVQVYDDPAKALEWFARSLRTSRKNGWAVIYDGLPLQG
jgi:hypothetical protein